MRATISSRSRGVSVVSASPIALVRFGLNRQLQRRRPIRRVILGQFDRRRMPADAPHFVADAVDDGLAEIRLHGADVARLERVEAAEGVKRGFLNEVLRIQAPRAAGGQAAMGPALQRRQAALEQRLHADAIARLRPDHELDGRLVAQERRQFRR